MELNTIDNVLPILDLQELNLGDYLGGGLLKEAENLGEDLGLISSKHQGKMGKQGQHGNHGKSATKKSKKTKSLFSMASDMLLHDSKPVKDKVSFCELVKSNGYECEEHQTQTQDGYILKLFRMRNKKVSKMTRGTVPAILLQHGLFCSADVWIDNGKDKSVAYKLADAGFDVWLGNNRGNKYSRKHTHLDPDKQAKEFFDFSFENLGMYDVPANIDYVLEASGRESLSYIGHSQGTSQMFVALSTNEPAHEKKINFFAALAPISHMEHVEHKFAKFFKNIAKFVLEEVIALGIYEVKGPNWNQYQKVLCAAAPKICKQIDKLSEPSKKFENFQGAQFADHRVPAGASAKQIDHYAQLIASGNFQKYDYGKKKNMKLYGTPKPPVFDLSKIDKVPIAMFVGKEDPLGDPTDTEWEHKRIKSVVYYKVLDNFDHDSFLFAKNTDFIKKLIKLIKKYNK